jgi:uncharacterized protein YqjF (DUF2071 family)
MSLDTCERRPSLSEAGRRRLLSLPGEPLFIADWEDALMIHYEVDAELLQRVVPFELDLLEGRAFVSLVAFTMRGMRPRLGGRFAAWLLKPIGSHNFLNVRTYARVGAEAGIYFLAEWLSNRVSVALGPRVFGLPYKFGEIDYRHGLQPSAANQSRGALGGRVKDPANSAVLNYQVDLNSRLGFQECEIGSLQEWLMERYTAYTQVGGRSRFFRVWHPPWAQVPAEVAITDQSLLEVNWPFFRDARVIGGNLSPGVRGVWMGWPHQLRCL